MTRIERVLDDLDGGSTRYRVWARQCGGGARMRSPEHNVIRTLDGRAVVMRSRYSSRETPYLPDYTSRLWEGDRS